MMDMYVLYVPFLISIYFLHSLIDFLDNSRHTPKESKETTFRKSLLQISKLVKLVKSISQ